MRTSKIALFLLIGLLLLAAAGLGALWLVDPAVFRDQIETRASAAFGRPFRIEGGIGLERSLRPRIILHGITIANPDWTAAEYFARAEEVAVQVALMPLLLGEMQVLDVRLAGMELFTEIRPDGANNFTFGDGGDRQAPQRLPSIERLLIRNAVIHHRLARGKIDRYEITQAQLWNIPGEPERIEAEGSVRGMPYRIQFAADSAAELSGPQNPWAVHLEMQGPDMTLNFDGQMAQAFTWDQFEGRLAVRGQQVELLETLLEAEIPLTGPFEIAAALRSHEGVYRLTDLVAQGQGPSGRPVIEITDGVASGGSDAPLTIALRGSLDDTPLGFRLESERFPMLAASEVPWPLTATLNIADTDLVLQGTLSTAAAGGQQFTFDGRLQGDSFDTLARFVGRELPKTGPYRLAFQADLGENGGEITGLQGFIRDTFHWQTIQIEHGRASADVQGRVAATVTAALDGIPLSLNYQGGPQTAAGLPVQIEATLPGTAVKADGAVVTTGDRPAWQFATTINGNRLATLGHLMAVSLPDIGNYDVNALIHGDGGVHELRNLRAQVNDHRFSGNLRWADKTPRPLITGRLSAGRLSLKAFTDTAARPTASKTPSGFLSQPLDLDWLEDVDARLEIDLKRVTDGVLDVEKIRSSVTLNEGRLRVPFQARVAGTPVKGQMVLTQRRSIPDFSLQATIGRLDAGKTLRKLKLPVVIDGHVETVEFDSRGRGATLQAMIDQAEASLRLSPASLRYKLQLVDQKIVATVERVKFAVQPRHPITATFSGIVQQVPFEATLRAGNLGDWQRADGPLPVGVALQAADLRLTAEGTVNRPFENKSFNLAHDLSGPQIEKLTPLIDLAVPLRGEFHAQGTIAAHGDRFVINENLRVGNSDLQAALTVWRSPGRPRISAKVMSRKIHLDEIKLFEARTKDEPREATRYVIPDYRIPVDALQSVDLEFDLQAERIVTRMGDLGNLVSQVRLKGGLLNSSLTVTGFTGARLRKTLDVNTTVDPPLNRLRFEALGLDYGYLERQMRDSNLAAGQLDLYLDLAGPGATRRRFLGSADGHVTIIGGPGQITGRRLDLWAADLIPTMLSPRWQRQSATDVNCVVAHIGVTEGLATIEDLLLDTRRITIAGSGNINLETEAIGIFIAPRPKRTSMISLANPVEIKGTLAQPEVSVARLPSRRRLARTGLLAGLINPLFLLTTFSDLGTNVADPCGTAVERAEASIEESPP